MSMRAYEAVELSCRALLWQSEHIRMEKRHLFLSSAPKEWCVPLPKIHTSYQSSYRSRSGYDMLGPDQHCILCLLSKSWKSDVDTVRLWKCLDVLHRRLKIYRDTWNSNPNGPVVLVYLHIGTYALTPLQSQREHYKRWDWSRSRRLKSPHNRSVVMVRVLRLGQRSVCTPCRW